MTQLLIYLLALALLCAAWWWLARKSPEPLGLPLYLGASVTGRVLLGGALFFISAWGLPVFQSLQLGGGFWSMAPDVKNLSYDASWLVRFWRQDILVETVKDATGRLWMTGGIQERANFTIYVALFFRWLGQNILWPTLFNALAAGLAAWPVWRLCQVVSGDRLRWRCSTALVMLWPSSLIWSAFLLKDGPAYTLVFAFIYLCGLALGWFGSKDGPGPFWPVLGALLAYLGLFFLRPHVALASVTACLAAHLFLGLTSAARKAGSGWTGVAVFALLALVVTYGVASVSLRNIVMNQPLMVDYRPAKILDNLKLYWPPELRKAAVAKARDGRESQKTKNAPAAGPEALAPQAASGGHWDVFTTGIIGRLGGSICWPLLGRGSFWERVKDPMRALMALETLVLLLLLPGIAVGAAKAMRQKNPAGLALLMLGLGLVFIFSVLVFNKGTAYRIRVQGWLPLFVLFDPAPYQWLYAKLRKIR